MVNPGDIGFAQPSNGFDRDWRDSVIGQNDPMSPTRLASIAASVALLMLALGSIVPTASAAPNTANATARGSWALNGSHAAGNKNYCVGDCSPIWRNYFVFDLDAFSSLAGDYGVTEA